MYKIAWHQLFSHPLPENHRFPMEKYNLLPEQLLYEGTVQSSQFFNPTALNDEVILLTHSKSYLHKLNNLELSPAEVRRIGFSMSSSLILREKIIMQGTLEASLNAFNDGIAFNVAGGTHHAFTDKGEGFCLLNDIAIAANFLLKKKLASLVLIVDLDVHQGNGTAKIFENNPHVFTFSMHGKKNYPLRKEQSDLDIELEDDTEDNAYLKLLETHLLQIITQFKPDFIFYQAGVDVLAEDKLGRLALTMEGCKARDKIVLALCKQNNIPVAVTMGGGYSPNINTIVNAHANTFRLANDLFF
jgi:acetoin utilization deacetylase AcuC-like enzyme